MVSKQLLIRAILFYFERLQQSKMAIFKLCSILKKTKARWDILIMFSKIAH